MKESINNKCLKDLKSNDSWHRTYFPQNCYHILTEILNIDTERLEGIRKIDDTSGDGPNFHYIHTYSVYMDYYHDLVETLEKITPEKREIKFSDITSNSINNIFGSSSRNIMNWKISQSKLNIIISFTQIQ